MGGNALSKPSIRLNRDNFLLVEDVVVSCMEKLCKHVATVVAYSEKQDFGDLDVLYVPQQGVSPQQIAEALGATEVVRNGDVTSIGYPFGDGTFQVDLIKCKEEYFEWAQVYFGYNDLGNLMGRIAHKMGFKYGHDGFWYVMRDEEHPTQVVAEILVSRDPLMVFDFLGYNYVKYLDGFKTLEDIFKYVAYSKYFNSEIYLLHNRNHTARVRDKKRKTYMEFLKWCEETKPTNVYFWEEEPGCKKIQKTGFLIAAQSRWSAFNQQVEHATNRHNMRKEAKRKFNGDVVKAITGLEGKELGGFMAEFKKSWLYDDHFWHWVYTVPQEDVEKVIKSGWGKYENCR